MAKPPKKYSILNNNEKKFIKNKLNITKIEDIDITILKRLKESLKKLKDSRQQFKIIYKSWDVIMCTILASLADNNTWSDIREFVKDHYNFFRKFLQMTGGIPTEDTFKNIMSIIDSNELNAILINFFQELVPEVAVPVKLLNFDGRVNNGSKKNKTILNEKKNHLTV